MSRGRPGRKATRPDVAALGGAYAEFDRLMRAPQFLEWLGKVCGIQRLLYDPEYAGGGTHENLERPGSRFSCRLQLPSPQARCIAA